jgi:hypothetical protein
VCGLNLPEKSKLLKVHLSAIKQDKANIKLFSRNNFLILLSSNSILFMGYLSRKKEV